MSRREFRNVRRRSSYDGGLAHTSKAAPRKSDLSRTRSPKNVSTGWIRRGLVWQSDEPAPNRVLQVIWPSSQTYPAIAPVPTNHSWYSGAGRGETWLKLHATLINRLRNA